MSIVLDASAVVTLLIQDDGADRVGAAISHDDAFAPDLIDVEVASSFRRFESKGLVNPVDAARAVRAALRLPITRTRNASLVLGAWSSRHNVSIYDGIYVSLARRLDCPLMTRDRRLATASDLRVPIILLPS
jgi:predicted nucleic acid-binding protein